VFHPCSIAQGDDPILGQSGWRLIAEFVPWVLARADAARWTDAGRAEAFLDDTPVEVFGPSFEGVKINYEGNLARSWQTFWFGPCLVGGELGSPGDVGGARPKLLPTHRPLRQERPCDFLADSGSRSNEQWQSIDAAGCNLVQPIVVLLCTTHNAMRTSLYRLNRLPGFPGFRALCVSLLTLAPGLSPAAEVAHVVHISLDGLGANHLQFYLTNAPEQFPNFIRLQAEGASTLNARCDYDFSETVPNHATMFMARPVSQPAGLPDTTHHGYNNNFPAAADTFHNAGNLAVPYKASFFDVAHDYGLSTALYTGKTRLAICERSYNAANGAPDLIEPDHGQDKIDFASVADVSGANISNEVNLLVADLSSTAPRQYSFIHIAEPDLTGHGSGWGSANWSNAVRNVDAQLGRILDTINANPVLSDRTAVIIAADHGGGGVVPNGHTEAFHPANYTIPFFLWGPGIPGGVDAYALFTNRGDPGTNRADYSFSPQPLRGGDGANLALGLLGLPPIPGSFFMPELKSLQPPMTVNRTVAALTLSWPAPADGFFLEFSERVDAPVWRKVTNGVLNLGDRYSYTVDLQTAGRAGFFRVRTTGLSIRRQPRAQTVFAGEAATFEVTASGSGPLFYQWYYGSRRILQATNAMLTVPNISTANTGHYRVRVSDYRDEMFSEAAALSVLTAPQIIGQPLPQSVATNGTAQFSVQAAGSGTLAYQWRKNGTTLDGATAPTLSVPNVQLADDGLYSVVVTDANGSVESQPVRLTVLIAPFFVQQPVAQTVTLGESVTFTATVEGNPLPFEFEWRRGSIVVARDTVSVASTTFTIPSVRTTDAGVYRAIVRNAALPTGRTSQPAALTVLTNAP
jgi:hypothetical protein